jgi:hypothetical protein
MAPHHMMPNRPFGRRFRRFMAPWRRRMMMEQARRQAEEADYLRGGWGEPGWAMNATPGYAVPGTMADNPPMYYGAMPPFDMSDIFDQEIDAILAQEDAMDRQEQMEEDYGALSSQDLGPATDAQTTVAVFSGPEDRQQFNHFWDSLKMGAGIGIGFLGVATAFNLLTRR